MSDALEVLKLLADPTRLRLLALLRREELSVAELQEILDMGQSRISSHLGLLRQGGLVEDRKEGKRSYYSWSLGLAPGLRALLESALEATRGAGTIPPTDIRHLERIVDKRRRHAEAYFDAIAGRLGKKYCPGRSWEAMGHLLLRLTPAIDIVDLGAGEGLLSQLLARRARTVICVDNAPRMVEVGQTLAREHGIDNLRYLLGDIESVPLADQCCDLVLLSQALHHAEHPRQALAEAHRLLRTGGQVLVLDLYEHSFEKARELYADRWLGFTHNRLYEWLREAGFQQVSVETVAREEVEPHFETILAAAVRR